VQKNLEEAESELKKFGKEAGKVSSIKVLKL